MKTAFTDDLRILEEDEISELVKKVEFLDYLVRTKSKSENVSRPLSKFNDYFEEIKMYNVAVSMFNEEHEGEFTRIMANQDYGNHDFKEHIEWSKRLRKWRDELATSRLSDLIFELSKAIPRGDANKDDYLEVYYDIIAGKNIEYIKQEAGITHSIPRSGMDTIEGLACQRAKIKLDGYFRNIGEEAE